MLGIRAQSILVVLIMAGSLGWISPANAAGACGIFNVPHAPDVVLQTMLNNLQAHLRTTVMGEVILDLSAVDPGDASAVAIPAWVLPTLDEPEIDLLLPLN